ncbi:PREDICTED: meiosis-specific with OB domain-containing protein [Nanorana parkeri]|uniref:meiosis-specific with OB domain-containing protein n=1 Tax=Nanorana parkeri TaxID=125878 RepID=UPI000854E908|nr:PREDICTED: meiosis-specific with OB domain-containing protein [Nanorana parkeri]
MASCTFRQAFVNISDLHPNLSRPSIMGIVIGKTDVKGFPDRKNFGSERYTFRFTIRDSPAAFINASSWGREEYIKSLSESFRVGDCVMIENPLVQTKDLEKEEKFNPSTPGCYKLLISEVHSVVKICSNRDTDDSLLSLLHVPTQHPHDYYSLEDIVANGQSLNQKVINILAAVRQVGEVKSFTTSDKRAGQRCEVKLFDYSVDSFPMICWDNESIKLAQSWTPRETVLFASELRINHDSFRNSMVATVVSKTIFTPNPDIPQAQDLLNHARECAENEAFVEASEETATELVNLETIKDVYTVQQIMDAASHAADKRNPLYGIVFAFISLLNVDDSVKKIVRARCSRCRYFIKDESEGCNYAFCNEMSQNPKSALLSLDLQMDISDHTGTLPCNLSDKVAEDTLSCTVDGFFNLTEDQKTSLKWNFVLERFKIYVKVSFSPKAKNNLRVNILSCKVADPTEAVKYMLSGGNH